MGLPFFFQENIAVERAACTLNETSSRHIVQVLRMEVGEQLLLTNGKGFLAIATIEQAHKKHCEVRLTNFQQQQPVLPKTTIGISLLKNTSRFEWFLEKATELGITEIIPLLCQHTEKQHFRMDRMKNILVSALLQSEQSWLPVLQEPQPVERIIRSSTNDCKWIGHCVEGEKEHLVAHSFSDGLLLIGPEGDFSKEEINLALEYQFMPVTLGTTRLRTETAGVAGAVLMRMGNIDFTVK
jgi:16S rRNA (uracil1498-N3)-methyltransferase